jgi:hypothetical protein
MPTHGGTTITLTGTNFGPATGPAVVVTYGVTGTRYAASGCAVLVPNTQIQCTSLPGIGAHLAWKVRVGGQLSALSVSQTSYTVPNITSLTIFGGASSMPTVGGTIVTVNGTNFGPLAFDPVNATYGVIGTEYAATSCVVTVGHVTMRCYSVTGIGARLR